MKKIIGIIANTLGFNSNNPFDDKYYVQDTYVSRIKSVGGIPIIISPINLEINYDSLELCDAFLLIGGKKIYKYHFDVIDYVIKNNKKLLGICMGMQAIAMYSNNDLEEKTLSLVNGHYFDNVSHEKNEILIHNIYINKYSKLASLIGNVLKVNSIHNYEVNHVSFPFKVVGISLDGVVEAIEYKNIIGVQFHPELMKETDELFKWLTI